MLASKSDRQTDREANSLEQMLFGIIEMNKYKSGHICSSIGHRCWMRIMRGSSGSNVH